MYWFNKNYTLVHTCPHNEPIVYIKIYLYIKIIIFPKIYIRNKKTCFLYITIITENIQIIFYQSSLLVKSFQNMNLTNYKYLII